MLPLRLSLRLYRNGEQVHAKVRLRWLLIGLGMFLFGVAALVLGERLAG